MTPATMEMIMFLKINRGLWDPTLIVKIRRNPRPRPVVPENVLTVQDFLFLLDHSEMADYQNVFISAEEDGDYWEDDVVPDFLGGIDLYA